MVDFGDGGRMRKGAMEEQEQALRQAESLEAGSVSRQAAPRGSPQRPEAGPAGITRGNGPKSEATRHARTCHSINLPAYYLRGLASRPRHATSPPTAASPGEPKARRQAMLATMPGRRRGPGAMRSGKMPAASAGRQEPRRCWF